MIRPALLVILLLAAATAVAAQSESELIAEVSKLQDEGTKWFNVAGNTDLSHTERNKARKKAYGILKEAYAKLDAYVTEHPGRAEALEDRMVKIHMMTYWIRKESPIGLLSGGESKPIKPAKPPPGFKPGGPGPGPGPKPPGPGPGPGPEPAPPAAPDPADAFREAEQHERKNPSDIAGSLERYREFMARFPDPDSDLFSKALERCSVLNSRLKDAYRELRQEDPDTLDPKRTLSPPERVLVLQLTRALKSKNEEERRRAAMDLGLLGSTEASYHLVRAFKAEKTVPVRVAIAEALVKIGGKKTAEQIGTLKRERKTDYLLAAIKLLGQIGRKDPVQGKYAGLALAGFVHSSDGDAGRQSFDMLRSLGKNGGSEGLCEAVLWTKAPVSRRIAIIEALGTIGDPRAARVLGKFFIRKGSRLLRDETIKALKQIGIEVTPYLIPYLRSPSTAQYTSYALRLITKQQLGSRPRDWAEWWKRYQAARGK